MNNSLPDETSKCGIGSPQYVKINGEPLEPPSKIFKKLLRLKFRQYKKHLNEMILYPIICLQCI